MRSEDIPKTAFTTPKGNYDVRFMPMGLRGAASTFQYTMDEAFREPARLPDGTCVPFDQFVAVYLNDICIFSRSKADHLLHVAAVLQRVRDKKLYVKPSKCEWLQTSIEFLGHQWL
jgi:hypothetical protein